MGEEGECRDLSTCYERAEQSSEVLGGAAGVRCIHYWSLQEHSDTAKVPGFGRALTLTLGFAARGWVASLLFNLTPKCQYICRSFLCGGAFILSRNGSSDLLPSVGLGVGAHAWLLCPGAGRGGWLGGAVTLSVETSIQSSSVQHCDPTLYELMSGCLWFIRLR